MAFVMVLSWSRRIFLRFSLDARKESFLRGHVQAFETWGGLPRVLLYDNLKSAVLQHGIALIIHKDCSTEQAVAVAELLGDLQEVICRHYHPQLQEFMRQDRGAGPNAYSDIHEDDVAF